MEEPISLDLAEVMKLRHQQIGPTETQLEPKKESYSEFRQMLALPAFSG